MVQICPDRVLIVGVYAGSGASGGFGRGAAAERAGGVLPRRGIAGDGQSGVPVAVLDSGLALELVRGTSMPRGHSAGCCGVRRGVLGGEAGRRYSSEESRMEQGHAEDTRGHGGVRYHDVKV